MDGVWGVTTEGGMCDGCIGYDKLVGLLRLSDSLDQTSELALLHGAERLVVAEEPDALKYDGEVVLLLNFE